MSHHESPKLEHVELASKDPKATQKFLEAAFGWKFSSMPGMEYAMLEMPETRDSSGVGVRPVMGPEHPGSIGYITVANIDESLKTVQAAGAKVVMGKTEIPGMGWSAVYIAPGEVVQGLYQNKQA